MSIAGDGSFDAEKGGCGLKSTHSVADYECAICMELLAVPVTLACGHTFCVDCLRRIETRLTGVVCPTCRTVTDRPWHDWRKNVQLAGVIEREKKRRAGSKTAATTGHQLQRRATIEDAKVRLLRSAGAITYGAAMWWIVRDKLGETPLAPRLLLIGVIGGESRSVPKSIPILQPKSATVCSRRSTRRACCGRRCSDDYDL